MKTRMLLAAAGVLLGLGGSAGAATYHCLPVEVAEAPDRVVVRCGRPVASEGGYPTDGADSIRYFAVPRSDAVLTRRFTHVVHTALTAGLVVRFLYTTGDTSGTAFGCAAHDCRTPSSFGLLAPASEVRVPAE